MVNKQEFIQTQQFKDFATAVALGLVPGAQPEVSFGHNPNASQNITTDVWENGAVQAIYIFPAVAGEIVEAVSDSLADVGIVLVIDGLDVAGLPQRQTVTLNGTTEVPVPGVWTSITRAFNDGADEYIGTVVVQGDGSTTTNVFASAAIDDQQTSQAIYTVPSNKLALVNNFSTAVNKSGGADVSCLFALRLSKPGNVFRTQIRYGLQVKGVSNISSDLIMPIPAGPGARLKVTAESSANTTDISAEFSMVLIDLNLVPPAVLQAITEG